MDLNLDLLSRNGEIITVALSHYYEQNGDLIADPDMVVRIDTKTSQTYLKFGIHRPSDR